MQGKVVWYDLEKGYGFVRIEEENEFKDFFIHAKNIIKPHKYKPVIALDCNDFITNETKFIPIKMKPVILQDDIVEFELEDCEKGIQIINCKWVAQQNADD